MDKLPKELWIEIFEYLNTRELITLTETCKEFKAIVLETKLVENFILHINNDRKNLEWNSERKYCQLKINDCSDFENFFHIIQNVGRNLKKIFIIKSTLKMKDLGRIFDYCDHLKIFNFCDVNLLDVDQQLLSIQKYRNISIYIEGSSPELFNLFMDSTAKEIVIDNKCSANNVNFDPFNNFLKIQNDLENLGLIYFSLNTNLFINNELDFVKFRLKNFLINNVYLNTESVAKFKTFMLNHINSLKCIHCSSPFIDVSFFNQFPALKELHLSHTNAFFDSFENIEKLTVENVSGNFFIKFPNIQQLTMIYKYGVFLGMYADLIKLLHLHELCIIDSKIPELNIPFVSKLSLKNVTITAKRPFKYEDNQIRELFLESCNTIGKFYFKQELYFNSFTTCSFNYKKIVTKS